MSKNESDKDEKIKNLISSGTQIAEGAISGALGFLAGDSASAILEGTGMSLVAIVLKRISSEVSERVLAPREKIRVGGVLAIAAASINERIASGAKLREDNFFSPSENNNRSNAEEIAESVILKAQKEPEERKIPFMGNLLSNICFDSSISVELGHQMIKTAEQLTYRQLCILKLSYVKERFDLRKQDYRGQESFPKELYQVLYEYLDLYNRGLINFGGEVALGPTDIKPGSATIQGIGTDIFKMMSLADIPDQDVLKIAKNLA